MSQETFRQSLLSVHHGGIQLQYPGGHLKISNPEDTQKKVCLSLGLNPEMLSLQTCIKSGSQRQNYLEAKDVSGSSTCMGPFQDLGEAQGTCSHSFPREGIPKLQKHVKPGPSPARHPVIWSHYYGRWRRVTSTHSNQMGKAR